MRVLNRLPVNGMIVRVIIVFIVMLHPVFAENAQKNHGSLVIKEVDLKTCIQEAMENNRRRPASRYAIEMAEAQHRQALAGYWPQINARGGFQRMDEISNFIFPSSTMAMPMGGSITVTIPGLGPVPVSSFPIPAQDVKLMDRDSYRASLDATWLLYDGGMRKGYRKQSEGLVKMMKQESRRTDLEIMDSVKRLYWGAVMAGKIHQIGQDALARMETTLGLTETMYKEGSGRVKKTDWLDTKVMVESLRAVIALMEKNELMAQAALANTMGRPWNSSVVPTDRQLPFTSFANQLDGLVTTAYRFNPDWAKVEAGILAAEGAVKTAQSGHSPKLALTGNLFRWWNDYEGGMATDRNKEGWNVGIGVEIPLFNGFLHTNKVAESLARVRKIKQEQFLLQEGIGLQIRDIFLSLSAAEKAYTATLEAMKAAQANRDLNTRAYQHELVETEKVIRAQLMDSFMSAQHYKALYEHIALQSKLSLAVGTEVMKKLSE